MPPFSLQVTLKYLEAVLITGLFVGVGYLLHSEDPCFVTGKIDFSIVVLTLLTLFFGWPGLFGFLLVYGTALALFYPQFPIYQMLELLITGLILYFFYYLWETRLKHYALQKEYFRQKLDENSNAFYTLKAAYDQLEKAYMTKPHSLKDSVEKIMKMETEDTKEAKREFLRFLSQQYHVKKSYILTFDTDEHLLDFDALDLHASPDSEDLLIREALEKRQPVYIDFEREENQTRYLAVIPLRLPKGKMALLVIEDMLFTAFEQDTLLETTVVFSYFMQSLQKKHFIEEMRCRRHYLSEAFAYELCKMEKISREQGVPSSLIVLRSSDEAMMRRLYTFLQRNIRTVDSIQTLTVGKREFIIIVLFPFLKRVGVEGFVGRMKREMQRDQAMRVWLESDDFRYEIEEAGFAPFEHIVREKHDGA